MHKMCINALSRRIFNPRELEWAVNGSDHTVVASYSGLYKVKVYQRPRLAGLAGKPGQER